MNWDFSFTDMFIGSGQPVYWIIAAYLSIWCLGANYLYVRLRMREKSAKSRILETGAYFLMFLFSALLLGQFIVNMYFPLSVRPPAGESLGIHFAPLPAAIYFVAASLAGQLGAWFLRKQRSRPSNAGLVLASLFHFIMPGWGLLLFGFVPAAILVTWGEIILTSLISFHFGGQRHVLRMWVFFLGLHLLASLVQPLLVRRHQAGRPSVRS
jgi:hypothetical protein